MLVFAPLLSLDRVAQRQVNVTGRHGSGTALAASADDASLFAAPYVVAGYARCRHITR